jgi:CelD/BcsL family acetyltransferase involved in cellulose biosynthesis
MVVQVVAGDDALHRLGPALDDLMRVTHTPLVARRPWLQAWVDSYPSFNPAVVVVRGVTGQLEAAAPLGTRRRGRVLQVVNLGQGPSDAAMLPSRTSASADTLAQGVADWLDDAARTWSLSLRHLVRDDSVAPALQQRLDRVRLDQGAILPQLQVTEGPALSHYVSSRHGQEVRRRRRRMVKDGLDPCVEHAKTYDAVLSLLPEMERVFRARDAALGRPCALDHESHGAFFREVVRDHASRGEVKITALRLGGSLAAYVLCFLDGGAHRMWNCRFDPQFGRYSPGMVAMDASVEEALTSGCEVYDFMRGDEPYKQSYANRQERALDLRAWSSSVLEARFGMWAAARSTAERLEDRGGRPARIVSAVRRTSERVLRL